ncbi:uncharacterized protein DS421_17g596440 [Arachis hypogaea]|nr:uncharacterized protein DS421_17g596440 [Arachis hypogaea]
MSEPKKAIVRELGFGGLMHTPPMNVPHKLLKELANSFKLEKNTLETSYGSFKVKPKTIEDALGLNASGDLFPDKVSYKNFSEENQLIFRRFQGNTLKQLTDEMMSIDVENEQDRLMFKRIFILYIQMAFLLPSTTTKVSPVHIAPIFEMEKITEDNWGAHVKKSIDGCLYALMIIYFYLRKNKEKKGEEKAGVPWVSNWNREQLVARIRAEINGYITDVDVSSESESEEDLEEPTKKQPKRGAKKMESRKRKHILEDSSSESKSESTDETQSKKRKHVIEDSSSEEENHSYDGMPEVSLATETDPLFQGQTEQSSVNKPSDSMFSREEESLSDPAQQQIIVFRPSSQPLDMVPIQLCLPSSQAISESPVPPFEPSPNKEHSRTPKIRYMSTRSDPTPEATAAALLMMVRTVSYVPKELPLPSFSLGLTDSSQEETQTQEGVGQAEDQVIVTAMCLILNQENIKRFQEEIYCLPPNIVNMAIGNHPNGEFLQPKSKKPFNVEDYPMFIPFLDRKKLASHPYGYVISRIKVYAGGTSQEKRS